MDLRYCVISYGNSFGSVGDVFYHSLIFFPHQGTRGSLIGWIHFSYPNYFKLFSQYALASYWSLLVSPWIFYAFFICLVNLDIFLQNFNDFHHPHVFIYFFPMPIGVCPLKYQMDIHSSNIILQIVSVMCLLYFFALCKNLAQFWQLLTLQNVQSTKFCQAIRLNNSPE